MLRHHALREITTGLADMPGPFFVCADLIRRNVSVYQLLVPCAGASRSRNWVLPGVLPGFSVCGDRPGEEHHSRKSFVVYLLLMVIEMLSDVVDGAGDNTHRLGA